MPKPLKLTKTGKLALAESTVEQTARDWFEAQGWLYIPTKAEHVTRGGKPAFKGKWLDAVAVKAVGTHYQGEQLVTFLQGLGWKSIMLGVVLEWKRSEARTKRKHLAQQKARAEQLRRDGYLVYRSPEAGEPGSDDPLGHWEQWRKENL